VSEVMSASNFTSVQGSAILGVRYSLPEQSLTYAELETRFGGVTMKKVLSGTGIRNRRVATDGKCGSDFAYAAATQLLEEEGIDRASIDLLIMCTQTPDYLLPTTACVLHDRLGLKKDCACFDINLGCSQYVYALSVAHSMIVAGVASRALVLTGDTLSRTLHPRDKAVVPLLADGGSATLVGPAAAGQGFLRFKLGTDGSGHRHLMIPAGGSRLPRNSETVREIQDADGNVRSQETLYMNGAAIFHFSISVVPPTIHELLAAQGMTLDQIDLCLFHQANKFMLDYLVRKLGLPPEKTHYFIEEVGNTSGTTVPIVLREAWLAGKIAPGKMVLLIGFGVGLSWAATLIRWPDASARPVVA